MSEEFPPYGSPRAVSSVVTAERWALDLLRNVADALATAPRTQKADALRILGGSLTELERAAMTAKLL